MHPLIRDLKILSDNEVEQKILDLNKKYWQTQNLQAQHQISIALDTYKLEQESRRARQKIEQKNQQNGENDLDNLININ